MVRFLELKQGTPEWHAWRSERVTASNVPVILGESDFQTPYELWLGYINKPTESAPPNYAMARGMAYEGVVRDEHQLDSGREFYPVCVENEDFPLLGASLDGYSPDEGGIVLEIKVPSREKHEQALRGEIPLCYRGQVQAQLMASGAKRLEYVSHYPQTKSKAKVDVYPDPVYFERIDKAVKEFMERVRTKTPPMLTADDYVEAGTEELKIAMLDYSHTKGKMEQLAEILDGLKEKIKCLMPHSRVKYGNMKVSLVERKGSVDYAKVPELRTLDLEQYRKPATQYLDIRFSK